ncbi:hypothetical protein ACPTIX_13310, partial [Enterococcus faecalis]|uniref:hypothetical protein n=1 Tax=Enterococcus faecalis TaxID=1351 RepID=UPI003CC58590
LYLSPRSVFHREKVRILLNRLSRYYKYGGNPVVAAGNIKPIIILNQNEILNLMRRSTYTKQDFSK